MYVIDITRENNIPSFEITKEVTYKFYYDDLYSLVSRMEMYKNSGVKNIGFWRLGQEETAVWEYIKTEQSVRKDGCLKNKSSLRYFLDSLKIPYLIL